MEQSIKRFLNKHIIITGAAAGIGKGVALRFADEGGRVVIADRNRECGEAVAKQITESGGKAAYIFVDLVDHNSINELIKKAADVFGPVDIAVSNAGIAESQSSALDINVEEWDRVYDINTRGSFFFCKACAQNMMDNDTKGSIVTMGSLVARSAKGMSGAYASSKAAIIMFTKTLAKCLAPMGIRVNCVSPGIVATEIYSNVEKEMMMEKDSFADWLVEQSIASGQLLISRCGTSGDIAGAVAFLASDDAAYITAQNLSVDGGMDWCW
ncbi:MAG: SDR family oxidoreductase [Deltaproteobacteria bacterium]|nr:SDR family oxidoreductase [Deltaproteobacteria bacterium]